MRSVALLACMLPAVAFAALEAGIDTAPTPSETTTVCEEGLIFDLATQTCMTPRKHQRRQRHDGDDRIGALWSLR